MSVYSQYNHRLYPNAQLAYSVHHSTEAALLKVKNDILLNMNKQHITLLVLLDLSAAFDTVQHNILLEALNTLGLGRVSKWFRSYLSGRSQRILVRRCLSKKFYLNCGVPQGSCLGPLLFTIYTSSLLDVVEKYLPSAIVMQTIPNFTSLSTPQMRQVTWMPLLLLSVVSRRSGFRCVRINYC